MYATEFKTIINEPYIKIPDFELFKGHEVRVTLLNIDTKNETDELLQEFKKVSKNTSKIDSKIDILKLDEDLNSDIF